MSKFLRIIAAGVVAFTGCSADDTVSMVQQSVATEQFPPPAVVAAATKKSKMEAWVKAQEEAGAAFRAQRAKENEVFRIELQMIAERKKKMAADAAKKLELKAKKKAEQAAERKAKKSDISSLRLELKEQQVTKLKTKRSEQSALRTQVKESKALKKKEGESEHAELSKQARQQIKEQAASTQAKKAKAAAAKKADSTQPVAAQHGLMHLTFVDGQGKKERLTLPMASQMPLVMSTAGKHLGFDWHNMDFKSNGKSVAAEASLASSGLKDGDTITVTPRA